MKSELLSSSLPPFCCFCFCFWFCFWFCFCFCCCFFGFLLKVGSSSALSANNSSTMGAIAALSAPSSLRARILSPVSLIFDSKALFCSSESCSVVEALKTRVLYSFLLPFLGPQAARGSIFGVAFEFLALLVLTVERNRPASPVVCEFAAWKAWAVGRPTANSTAAADIMTQKLVFWFLFGMNISFVSVVLFYRNNFFHVM
mmetsp:Transcript_21973/g.49285  ORF Transcript_21973/g.49285 Transcript_21973/m.49285 type:complete len:201 (+) Transcript_21973:3093-3695(+)